MLIEKLPLEYTNTVSSCTMENRVHDHKIAMWKRSHWFELGCFHIKNHPVQFNVKLVGGKVHFSLFTYGERMRNFPYPIIQPLIVLSCRTKEDNKSLGTERPRQNFRRQIRSSPYWFEGPAGQHFSIFWTLFWQRAVAGTWEQNS
jgi:hypothetical protein